MEPVLGPRHLVGAIQLRLRDVDGLELAALQDVLELVLLRLLDAGLYRGQLVDALLACLDRSLHVNEPVEHNPVLG